MTSLRVSQFCEGSICLAHTTTPESNIQTIVCCRPGSHPKQTRCSKMATTPPFVLTRATAEDMPDILSLMYDCFPPHIRLLFMGCESREDLPKYQQKCIDRMQSDKADVWIQVRDQANSNVIAAANWKIYINGEPDDLGEETPDWVPEEHKKRSEEANRIMTASRKKANPGPFVHLHICFTSPEYRRRGAGSMLLQWGVDVMDTLFLPGWIEASVEGNFLYKVFGFYDYEKIQVLEMTSGTNMRRDVRSGGIVGGRSVP
ncbi:hypothetical protein HII31_00909 [Pseudocercospora fuligena]|uniref:N-acetyltransferase domain-containing protein n=1 Tax=Pseudocercospora fuligena TaxID=685502 RepID=A0A8H6RTX9_9PEZI|nr:hypothetical protein HII31_00909 [Pseudocercospora fuligena]